MKKLVLICAAGLILGGAAFAKEDNGALAFGVVSDSSEKGIIGGGIRGAAFLDIGYQLAGPIFYGFEFQGAVKKMAEDTSDFKQQDIKVFDLGDGDWAAFSTTSLWSTTVTRWDADFSPRGYVSVDLGSSVQLLGFLGLNYNWNTIDYTIKNQSSGPAKLGGVNYTKGEEKTESKALDGVWDLVAGFRVSVGAFYIDYLRFLKPTDSGDYTWNASSKNRLGAGITLRF